MRYQLMVLEALPRGAALEALAASLPRCVSSCAMELCRMEPFPGPMVVGVSDDEAEIREACARLEAARCTVCVVDRGAHIRDLVERVSRRSGRPPAPEPPPQPGANWRGVGLAALVLAVVLAAWAGLARRSPRPTAAASPVPSVEVAAEPQSGPAAVAPAVGPLGQLLARMSPLPADSAQAPARSYGAWMQQFRARAGVASSPMPPPSAASESAPSQGASPRRRTRRRARLSAPMALRATAAGRCA